MDHGLCFIRSGEDLTPALCHIDKIKQSHLYGLFPEFKGRLRQSIIDQSIARLREMDAGVAQAVIATVPREWKVAPEACEAWAELISRRAVFVADNIQEWVDAAAPWFAS